MTRQFADRRLQELEVALSNKSQLQPCYRQLLESVEIWNFRVIVYFRYWRVSSTVHVCKPATTLPTVS